ncbi:aspartyl protease family protein [Pedobacter sp. MC2016-05]|uniref:aspartyl protease family protein n=1 Tax=Pedobacter sp. MC2016-05 TaxID=2994474 RepID=UPI002246057F|nr:aspartyl protease family protein [Pedobacter sp. MC2016-05]MCX2477314.1 aspartyl protease family protein [Pedobacter sp. MC2016-05]
MKKRSVIFATLLFLATLLNAQDKPVQNKLANLGELVKPVINDTIPIKIWNDYILLKVTVNGIENDFLWDNGFSFSAIEQSLAPNYKLKAMPDVDTLTAQDAVNNKVNFELKIADVMRFGKTAINNSPFLGTDMSAFFGQSSNVKGILGASAIKKLNWKFNFDENYVVVSEKPFEGEGKMLPFQLDPNNQMNIELRVNGYTAPAEIDFGMNSDDLGVSIGARQLFSKNLKSPSYGIGGASMGGMAKMDTIYAVTGFDYSLHNGQKFDFPFEISLSSNDRGARFGNRFFRKYNPIINFSTSEIILLKRESAINPMPDKNYGFVIIKVDGELRIVLKAHNANTQKYLNLRVDDVVKAIDGKPASEFEGNLDLRAYQLDKLINNKEIGITTADNKIIKLKPVENIYN